MDAARLGAGVDCRLGRLEIIGQFVAFGDVLAVAERDVADQPHFAFRFVVRPVVPGGDLGLGDDGDRPCRLEPLDAGVGRRSGLTLRRLLRSLSLRGGVVEKDGHRRAGHFRVALNDDDIAGVDRLVFLVVVNKLVRVDRDRLLRVCAGENCGRVVGFGGLLGARGACGGCRARADERHGQRRQPAGKARRQLHGLVPFASAAGCWPACGTILVLT